MVGGRVIGLARKVGSEDVLLHVEDTRGHDRCAVRAVERRVMGGEAVRIGLGDQVWWQSGKLYWTPRDAPTCNGKGCGTVYDIALKRIGCVH